MAIINNYCMNCNFYRFLLQKLFLNLQLFFHQVLLSVRTVCRSYRIAIYHIHFLAEIIHNLLDLSFLIFLLLTLPFVGDTTRQILLRGSSSGVTEAKKRIEDIIHNQMVKNGGGSYGASGRDGGGGGGASLDHPFIVKLPVPNDKVGIIIGKGGMTIKGIQERSRATVQIPPGADEDNPQVIRYQTM